MNEQTKQLRDALLVLMKAALNGPVIDAAVKDIYEQNAKAKHDNPEVTHRILSIAASRVYGASDEWLTAAKPELCEY